MNNLSTVPDISMADGVSIIQKNPKFLGNILINATSSPMD